MDPLSHVLFGRVLIGLDRRRRLGSHTVAACVLGALAPDIDAIFALRGWDIYLVAHQIGTHSVLGTLMVAGAAAALVRFWSRGGRYVLLLVAAWIGALSHLAFDILSGATIEPAWPLSERTISVPLVAMADPWLVAICVTAGLALWVGRRHMATVAAVAVVVIVLFFSIKGALLATALPHWTAARGPDAILSHAVEARWGSMFEWTVFDRTPHALRIWRVSARSAAATLVFSLPLGAEASVVAASRSFDTVRNFLHVHQLGFAVTAPMEHGETQVLWSDIRYCQPGPNTPPSCALWFGGIFERDGHPVTQIVYVGRWPQTR
jgi:membrane-bound metal-dependent hydrolase YbcI (DUF457 family)